MTPRLAALVLLLAAPAAAFFGDDFPVLWQERMFFDALLQARERAARTQSDPMLLPVMKAIAGQAAQQSANLQQIHSFVKAQKDNLGYAFTQPEPEDSLGTIQENFETLSKGAEQVRQNLYYLTARCRIASGQALQDAEMNQASLLILGQIQQLQLDLNALYVDATEVRKQVHDNKWAVDKFFLHKTEDLYRNVVRVQDAIFKVYNSALELNMRTK